MEAPFPLDHLSGPCCAPLSHSPGTGIGSAFSIPKASTLRFVLLFCFQFKLIIFSVFIQMFDIM